MATEKRETRRLVGPHWKVPLETVWIFFFFFFLTRLPTFINIFLLLLKNVFAYKEKKKKEAEAVTGSQSHLLHS